MFGLIYFGMWQLLLIHRFIELAFARALFPIVHGQNHPREPTIVNRNLNLTFNFRSPPCPH